MAKDGNKIQTGLRIPEALYDQLCEDAKRNGISINAQILFLLDVGMRAVNLGIREQGRDLARKRQDTDE